MDDRSEMLVGFRAPDDEPCAGPNHGNLRAQPSGYRIWKAGHALALIQTADGTGPSFMTFCSVECMCDWHGAACALAMSQEARGNEAFEIPGSFRLLWISPMHSSTHKYEDWDALTQKIGSFQMKMMAHLDAAEERARVADEVNRVMSEDDLT